MNALTCPELTIEHFEACKIDPERFDHESHVYMGWLYIREYGPAAALMRFDAAIKRLVCHLGAKDKYHATLTWFFMLLIAERMADGESWLQFRQSNPDILLGSKHILSRYYSEDFLQSGNAKAKFMLPNNLR